MAWTCEDITSHRRILMYQEVGRLTPHASAQALSERPSIVAST